MIKEKDIKLFYARVLKHRDNLYSIPINCGKQVWLIGEEDVSLILELHSNNHIRKISR